MSCAAVGFLPVVEKTAPESACPKRPLGGTLIDGGFEVGFDVGVELGSDGSAGEGEGEAVLDLAAPEDGFGVKQARLDRGERNFRAVVDGVDPELGNG